MAIGTDIYEMHLLSALLKDVEVLKKTYGIANSSLFSSALSVEIYDILRDFHQQYDRLPVRDELMHLYNRDKKNMGDDGTINGFLDVLYSQNVDSRFVVDELNRYVRLRKLENVFKESYEQVKSGNDIDVPSVVGNMFKVQMDTLRDKHIYGVSIDESDYILEQGKLRKHIPTSIDFLNNALSGGLAGGQLGIILAPPNYGKTMTLLNFAIYSYLKRHNVLFVTLEMPEFSILKRIMLIMSGGLGVNIDLHGVRKISERIDKKFMILYRPVRSITVDYLYSVVHQAAADGIKFDQIFIDYADLLASGNKQREKRFELAEIFTSLKSFAQTLEMPVWSATQSNREGLRAETVTMEHASESIDKMFISDVVLSMNEKIEANKVSKYFLTKHREGASDLYIDVFVNDKMWIDDANESTSNVSLDKI